MARWILRLAIVTAAAAVPTIDIDLDCVPEARFGNVSKHFTKEIRPMVDRWTTILNETLTEEERTDWLKTLKLSEMDFTDYYRELVGIVGWFMTPFDSPQFLMDQLTLFNAIYELGSPSIPMGGCSGILMADKKGQVFHARNLDYAFQFQMPDGRVLDLPDVTYNARYWKDGKVLMTAPSFLLFTGIHTGMRMDGWTFEQNTRHSNERHKNLAALKEGKGDLFGWRARLIMENTPKFQDAVKSFAETKFMAPQYFILSGKGKYEGAVITKDRGEEYLQDTPEVQLLSEENGRWWLLQTNDDLNKPAEDSRRPLTKLLLSSENQTQVEQNFMWKNIRSPTLVGDYTVFSWVANPQTGYSELITKEEAKAAGQLQLAARAGSRGRAGHTKWARKALMANEGM